jgi:hypothetical protein
MNIASHLSAVPRTDHRIQVDIGSNIFAGPSPIGACTIYPYTDSVHLADDSPANITGIGKVRGHDFFIAPSFSNALMPQAFVTQQKCSTILVNDKLLVLNNVGTANLEEFLASNASMVACSTTAENGLYFLSQEKFDCIKEDTAPLAVASAPKCSYLVNSYFASAVDTYHTVKFATLKDLVYYWHRIFRHCSKEKYLAIVKNKIFAGGLGVGYRFKLLMEFFPTEDVFESIDVYVNYLTLNETFINRNYQGYGLTTNYSIHKRSSSKYFYGGKFSYNVASVTRAAIGDESKSDRSFALGWLSVAFEMGFFY